MFQSRCLISLFSVILCAGVHTVLQAADFPRSPKASIDIYVASNPASEIKESVKDLKTHLQQSLQRPCRLLTHAKLAPNNVVLTDLSPLPDEALTEHPHPTEVGYEIQPYGVTFYGSRADDTCNAIYHFLEKEVGCRWFAPDETLIPTHTQLHLKDGTDTPFNPRIQWREVYYYEAFDPVFARRQRLNGNASIVRSTGPRAAVRSEKHGGWGLWCHSVYSLLGIPPEKLYKENPEDFAWIKGQRIPPRESGTQLCMTQPDVYTRLKNNLQKAIQKNPDARYWSVSQMDGHGFCTCETCAAADAHDGSHIGSILTVINQLAKVFPQKKIATLAYDYSRQPPQKTTLEKNVIIQLCNIETARVAVNEPIGTSPKHASFRNDITAWSRVCKEIVVWDYVVQFQTLVSPFPNFHVLQANVQFFADNHVTGLFCQGNRERGGEFAELRTYLLALLLRDPDCDLAVATQEFTDAYYGTGGAYIRTYLTDMTAALTQSGKTLSMDGNPEAHRDGYLSEANLNHYADLFSQACQAVKGKKSKYLRRIKRASAPILFAQIRLRYGSPAVQKQRLAEFLRICKENGIYMLSEVDSRKDQEGTIKMFQKKYAH